MSSSLSKFWKFIRKNETARGLLLVGIVILGALGVWAGIRVALNTEYPVLVVSSPSMCPPTNCVLPVGSLIVIRGQPPSSVVAGPPPVGSIIVFRPHPCEPDYLVVHRVISETNSSGVYYFQTKGDANGGPDDWADNCGGTALVSSSQVVGVYQGSIPIPYLGSAILGIRAFMYDDATGQPKPAGILLIVVLIVALFAFEVIEPSKKSKKPEAATAEPSPAPTPTVPETPKMAEPDRA